MGLFTVAEGVRVFKEAQGVMAESIVRTEVTKKIVVSTIGVHFRDK
jgi:hypothetical protein